MIFPPYFLIKVFNIFKLLYLEKTQKLINIQQPLIKYKTASVHHRSALLA